MPKCNTRRVGCLFASALSPLLILPDSASGTEDLQLLAQTAKMSDECATKRPTPLRPKFEVGVRFSEKLLPRVIPQDQWYWIPDWLVGSWRRDLVTTAGEYDYKTMTETKHVSTDVSQSVDDEGWQKDSRGEYWNYLHTPFTCVSEGENVRQIFIVTAMEPLEVSPKRVVKRFEGTGVLIDKATGVIKQITNAESIQSYFPLQPGVIVCVSTTTEFDAEGRPCHATKTCAFHKRTNDFRPRNLHLGKDLRDSFKSFLASCGKIELMPKD